MYGSPDRTPDSSPNARFPANIILDQAAADLLDEQGAISRFFYCAKAGKEERNAGLDGLRNRHPTVKPLDLCRYLATLILPPERDTPRKLIVPYAGSGSEIIGAVQADWDEVLGIEFDSRYVRIAERRIRHWILSMPTTGDE
jgi:site-specific DNA-methyltransferase (adenine-specific)